MSKALSLVFTTVCLAVTAWDADEMVVNYGSTPLWATATVEAHRLLAAATKEA